MKYGSVTAEIQVHVLWAVDISGKPGNLLDNLSFLTIVPT